MKQSRTKDTALVSQRFLVLIGSLYCVSLIQAFSFGRSTNIHKSVTIHSPTGHPFSRALNALKNSRNDDEDESDDEVGSLTPSQLEQLLQNSSSRSPSAPSSDLDHESRLRQATDEEIEAAERIAGNVAVPKTGISINDEMTAIQSKENYISRVFPLKVEHSNFDSDKAEDNEENNDDKYKTVAAIQTVTMDSEGDEPMRYLVALDQYGGTSNGVDENSIEPRFYAMIDVPSYSDDLCQQMKQFMTNNGVLSHILVTSRDGVHYDESPAVYMTRKSDMIKWKAAFPNVEIVMYRLDTPRDCQDIVTQSLDGYGPWAVEVGVGEGTADKWTQFNETGRPLTRMEWDEDIQAKVLDDGEVPPDDNDTDTDTTDDDELYTPQAIRKREENKNILAIYTPGHTYGSVTFIFPKVNICCSGHTIPVEDTRSSANLVGLSTTGPALDYRGYITTNSGGISRQIESSRGIINVYGDRFGVVLPSRGPPVSLSHLSLVERQRILHDTLNEYDQLGKVYESMGII